MKEEEFEITLNLDARVFNKTKGTRYSVTYNENGWACTCPDYTYRQRPCKHIWAVLMELSSQEVRQRQEWEALARAKKRKKTLTEELMMLDE